MYLTFVVCGPLLHTFAGNYHCTFAAGIITYISSAEFVTVCVALFANTMYVCTFACLYVFVWLCVCV